MTRAKRELYTGEEEWEAGEQKSGFLVGNQGQKSEGEECGSEMRRHERTGDKQDQRRPKEQREVDEEVSVVGVKAMKRKIGP